MDNVVNFDEEFASDQEVDEELDALLNTIGERIAADESRTSMVNLNRVRDVLAIYKLMKYVNRGTKAKVSYKLNEPFRSMGSVGVCGKKLEFKNPEWLSAAVKIASNFEAYPKTDGTVQMTFTFHGLTFPIE